MKQPTAYLLVQALQHLWPVLRNDVYQQFTYVSHTIQPGAASARCLQMLPVLTDSVRYADPASLSRQLHTGALPHPHVPVGY